MIYLHQYPKIWGLGSLSPFCLKVEVFLNLAGLPYEVRVELNPAKGPKGKMPFIQDDKEVISDSSFIIQHLIKKYHLHDFDIHESTARAQSFALKIMVEEFLYFALLHSRWIENENYKQLKKDFHPLFPPLLGNLALTYLRYNLKRQSLAQGLGRHSQTDLNHLTSEAVTSISAILGENEYFSQNRISFIDATLFAFLLTILKQPFDSHLKLEVQRHQNLSDFTRRMEHRLTTGPARHSAF